MAEMINFPLSSPQVQAAERIQSQVHHNPANVNHAQQAEAERLRTQRVETVVETTEAENPVIDPEGHLGAEYQAREGEEEDEGEEESLAPARRRRAGDEDDLQGRFINVVV